MDNEQNPAETALLMVLTELQKGHAQAKALADGMTTPITKAYANGKAHGYQEMVGKVTKVVGEYQAARDERESEVA